MWVKFIKYQQYWRTFVSFIKCCSFYGCSFASIELRLAFVLPNRQIMDYWQKLNSTLINRFTIIDHSASKKHVRPSEYIDVRLLILPLVVYMGMLSTIVKSNQNFLYKSGMAFSISDIIWTIVSSKIWMFLVQLMQYLLIDSNYIFIVQQLIESWSGMTKSCLY